MADLKMAELPRSRPAVLLRVADEWSHSFDNFREELIQIACRAFAQQVNAAIGQVLNKPGDREAPSNPGNRITKPNSLDVTVVPDLPS